MQTIDSKVSNVSVVAFNPAMKHSREKQALQLIVEYRGIREMADNMAKVNALQQWQQRALALASELSDQQQSKQGA